MTVQGLLGFYDNYLRGQKVSPLSSNNIYKESLLEQANSIDTFWKSQNLVSQKSAEMLKNAGNNYIKNNQHREAIRVYKRAIEEKPDYVDVYFNLGKSYKAVGEIQNAVDAYNKLIELNPNDVEALTSIGECYKDSGKYNEARDSYRKALDIDPKSDLASREIKEIENLKLAQTDPELARKKKAEYADKNLSNALNLVAKYGPAEYTDNMADIQFLFGPTDKLSGQSNIAQYENSRRRIVVTNKYIWAAPEVIAAYLVHEAVHADDRDPYTSIKEEQDAYKESVKFWLAHNNGIKDPEMDFAAGLYLTDPANLDKKVEEVYSSRDNSIPRYSPYHGMAASTGLFSKVKNLFSRLLGKQNAYQLQVAFDQGLLTNHCR